MNLEKVRDAAERVARSEGLEIVDVEWKVGGSSGSYGCTSTGCTPRATCGAGLGTERIFPESITRTVSGCLNELRQSSSVEEYRPGYILEVSSPGLDRALRNAADFERFRGRASEGCRTTAIAEAEFF